MHFVLTILIHLLIELGDPYVDGVSITYDTSEPKHIWTYATALSLRFDACQLCLCPCNNGSTAEVPPYVGSDYYCETGYNAAGALYQFFPNAPLWDGQQCDGVEAPCCTHPKMPWFIKTLNETTTEDIQLRLCQDKQIANEETLLQLIALYVY